MKAFSFPDSGLQKIRKQPSYRWGDQSMKHQSIVTNIALVAATTLFTVARADTNLFADHVTAYEPGIGFATDFASGLGFTNTVAALGAPSVMTPGDFGGPVTPFSPPFLAEQLLSIGEGGSVTFEFDPPIFNHPANPFGLDFIVYGNTGFSITNGNFSGGGITDGSTFSQNTGTTRVAVSADKNTFYTLDPSLAPTVDGRYPTDGSGRVGVPTNPSFLAADFAEADHNGIQTLYGHGAGGTGYDLNWAQTSEGSPIALSLVRFVRIEVLEGKSEIDALSAVLPNRSMPGIEIVENFNNAPEKRGWKSSGDPSLFQWDAEAKRLLTQWDSSKPNSYFYKPIGQVIDTQLDFSIAFDLELDSIEIGTTTDKPFTFPIAIGLIDLKQATRDDYFRGTGIHPVTGPRGVAEWNYLPDSGFGATVSSGLISQNNQWAFQNTFPLELNTGTLYQIQMEYQAATQIIKTVMTADGEPFGPLLDASLDDIFGNPVEGGFTQLNVDAFAISNYSDAGQAPPEFAGSVKALGYVDNIEIKIGSNLRINQIQIDSGQIEIMFHGNANTDYWLEQSSDLSNWMTVNHKTVIEPGETQMVRPNEDDQAFFRLRSQ